MRRRLKTRVSNSGKLLNEIRGVFMTDGRNFSSDLMTGLPRIIVPVNRDHTYLFLYRKDGDRMVELSYGIPENNQFPEGVDWTVSRVDITNNKFYITINPNSERARVNGIIAGAYRVGAGIEDDGEYIDFEFNPNNAMTTLNDSQFVDGKIGTGPIGTTTYFLDGSRRISQATDDLGLEIPPQNNGGNGKTQPYPGEEDGKTQPYPGEVEKDTVNEWHPPAEGVDPGTSANTEGDRQVEEEVQEHVEETGNTSTRTGTLIFKNFPPCGELTINGEKYESELWYRNDISYGIVKDVPRGNCDIEIKFGEIVFSDSVELRGRSARVFVDVFPIIYLIGLRRNWGVNIDGTSVPCIHDIVRNLSIIVAPKAGNQAFTIKLPDSKTKEFELDIPIGYTVIMLDRYPVVGEEPEDSTQFWARRRAPRRMPPREQPIFVVDPTYEDRFDRRRHRDVEHGYGGMIDPYGEYTRGAGNLSKEKSALPFVAAAVASYFIWKALRK